MRKTFFVCWVLLAFLGTGVSAQEITDETQTMVFEDMIIAANPIVPEAETLDKEILDWTRYINLGDLIDDIPGVNAVRRGASSTEPVIRGLGWERVQTQVGPIPIFGGCPARMDPPITYLQPDKVQKVTVVKGVPSVTLGPGGTGGRIVISNDYERSPDAPPEFQTWLSTKYDGAREGIWGGAGARGGNKLLDFYVALDALDYGDYESASGIEVPADKQEYGGAVSLGVRPVENHRWWNSLNFIRDDGFDSPSLPMDSDGTKTWIYNTGYRIDQPGCTLEQLEVNGGFSIVDHNMGNEEKSNWDLLHALADTDSDSFAGRVKQDWRLNEKMLLSTGADFYNISRDGTRERFVVPKNMTFFDHIWPDINQYDIGAFSELKIDLAAAWRLRAGGRFDYADSEADALDDSSIGGMSIRDQFVKFYGPDAAEGDQDDALGGGNLLLEWEAMEKLIFHLGGGVISRSPNVTELFYAFSPSPGGFQLGNPTLDPEIKYEIDLGGDLIKPYGIFSASIFYYWVNDYILPRLIGKEDIDMDGNIDLIRGYTNVDAQLYGAEVSAVLQPFTHWSFPMSIAYVRGTNESDDDDLPEIPPLEGRAAVRFSYGDKIPWWAEFGGRFVARQDEVSEEFPEDETAGFSLFYVFAGVEPLKGLRLLAGIENLFDKEYHEHLTRETAVTVDDLLAGDEIPGPGRSFHVMARYEF